MRRRMSAWGLIGQTPHHQEPLLRSRSKKRNTMVDVVKVEATCKSSLDTISADLSQGLLGELECPVCMEYMLPPITFCLNGHNICQNCKPQLSNCPTCRQPFVNIRNVALEKLARQMKYPCTFRKYGCKEKFSPGQIASHHASCRFSPQVCPLEKLRKVKCDWTGSVGEIKKHLKDEHKEQCLEYTGRHSLVLCGVKPTCGYFRVIFAHNEIFYRHFQIRNGALYATLQYIGPSENAAKFRYKVIFVNKANTECITFSQAARGISENLEDIFNSGNCVKLHYDIASRFVNDNEDLYIGMEIFKMGH